MTGKILLERSLPLQWRVLDATSPPYHQEQNKLILGLLDTLEEGSHTKAEGEQATEWKRIDAKLNLILQILSQLLQDRQPPLASVAIRFLSDTLAWQIEQPFAIGTRLLLSLYPEVSIPLAIHFEATVIGTSDGWMEVDIQGLNEEEQAMWSRWIFRQHRRQVAHARLASTP